MEKAYQLKAKIIEVHDVHVVCGTYCTVHSVLDFLCISFMIVVCYDDLITCASAEGHVILTGPMGALFVWQVLCQLGCTFSL